ncbi:voltage gated chloride channel domain-containing protein [Rhodotorula diobovata]|uniref:Voltage gated chloride channel domain-containing protein n=1 Tax=Rhodotorula diobovata TaxID=5288 RepID=A0A5C5G5G2_9BASI|nr:voltage gated chloride channel domain-containing protein [Rhodotorula diobovata]
MTSAPPTPLRPLCRTRRRSSSLSSVLPCGDSSTASSPDRGPSPAWGQYRSPTRSDAKRAKRTRVGYVRPGPTPRAALVSSSSPPVPHADPGCDEQLHRFSLWTTPSPFAAAPAAGGPVDPSSAAAPTTTTTTFCASAGAFALPGVEETLNRIQRPRNASTESASFPSHASLSSSKGSFDDSSFASDSPPQSLPSASTSPDSLGASALLAAVAVAAGSGSSVALPVAPPPLRRATSCNSPMLCDGALDPLATPLCRAEELGEAERLHHVAFEQLRAATREEEEHFVERMRRWEAARGDPFRAEGDPDTMEEDDDDEVEFVAAGGADDDNDDEVEVTLDLGLGSLRANHPPAVSRSELDELARRLQAGACELEDFSLVREVQARSRSKSARV